MYVDGCRRQPFKKWCANGSPVDDLSWLAVGYNLEKHTYAGEPCCFKYSIGDGGAMIAEAKRLLDIIEGLTEVPHYATHIVEVARCTLTCVIAESFPATPMIAHHWMIGGDFDRVAGWAVPMYTTTEYPYKQPGLDLLAGIHKLLRSIDVLGPQGRLPPLPVNAITQQITAMGTLRDQNMRIATKGFPRILGGNVRYPDGLVLFWNSDVMDKCHLSMSSVSKFEDDQLANCPISDYGTRWYVPYISAYAEYFIVFVREINPVSKLPEVTTWKIDGNMEDGPDGTRVYTQNAKLRLHHGMYEGKWYIGFLKEFWTPGTSLVCDDPRQSSDGPLPQMCFPLILDLHAERDHCQPRRSQLIRCLDLPQNLKDVMLYPGRGVYDKYTNSWKSIDDGNWKQY